jgi:hypothetical protein
MKPRTPPKLPNYVRKLLYLRRIGALPADVAEQHLAVYHDHWCGIYKRKRCNCDPDIKLKAMVPRSMN